MADPNRNTAPIILQDSLPNPDDGSSWFARASVIAPYTYPWFLSVYAICANVTTTTVAAANETAAAGATPVPPVSTGGDQAPAPVTTTTGAQTMFLPIVTQ